jgi:hypothetical protein
MSHPTNQEHELDLEETVASAADVLSAALDYPLRLEIEHSFRGATYRAIVLRCKVIPGQGSETGPATVIVKRFRGDQAEPYDPNDPIGARARFLNERTGLTFLQSVTEERPFGPAIYAADGQRGLVILEDLGEGECLADHLQGTDPEQVERALLAYATTLGRLHAATAGRAEHYGALHRELARGGAEPAGAQMVRTWLADDLPAFRRTCATLELPISSACDAELESLPPAVADPGPFLAYSVGDTCPDNHRYIPGDGDDPGYLRFYDMEFGGFQHALLDAAYLWMPFPTCWCVARFPDELPPRLEAAYRTELIGGCPPAADDATFYRAMTQMCAVWFILTVSWSLDTVLEEDEQWGISTVRQRFPLRAENVARVSKSHGYLPAFGDLARDFAAKLRARWGEAAEMPLYLPFR